MGSLGVDVNYIQGVRKFVRHLHTQFMPRLKLTVDVSHGVTGCNCSFMPCGVTVREILAFSVEVRTLVVDVKNI